MLVELRCVDPFLSLEMGRRFLKQAGTLPGPELLEICLDDGNDRIHLFA